MEADAKGRRSVACDNRKVFVVACGCEEKPHISQNQRYVGHLPATLLHALCVGVRKCDLVVAGDEVCGYVPDERSRGGAWRSDGEEVVRSEGGSGGEGRGSGGVELCDGDVVAA